MASIPLGGQVQLDSPGAHLDDQSPLLQQGSGLFPQQQNGGAMELLRRALEGFQTEQYVRPETETLQGSRFQTPEYDGSRAIGANDILALLGLNQRTMKLGEVGNYQNNLNNQLTGQFGMSAQTQDGQNRLTPGPNDYGMRVLTGPSGKGSISLEQAARVGVNNRERMAANPEAYANAPAGGYTAGRANEDPEMLRQQLANPDPARVAAAQERMKALAAKYNSVNLPGG